MNYKQIVAHMKAQKSFPYWRYGAPWLRMAFDTATKNVFLTQRADHTIKNSWDGIKESIFILRPDNTAILPYGDISSVILGSFGIAGKISHQVKRMIRDHYTHNLTIEYEAFAGLIIDFRTGKPLNARKIDSFAYNNTNKKIADGKIEELKHIYYGLTRLKGGATFSGHYADVPKSMWENSARDAILISIFKKRPEDWDKKLDDVMK